ncbi:MAG: hypothetical protein AAB932_06660 [Patescibacteria group bacterium]
MLEHLFGSKTRYRLLKTFFQRPEKPLFVRELTRILETQINAVRRELELLVALGIVKELERKERESGGEAGNQLRKYYVLNVESLLYPELQALILKGQVWGEQAFLKQMQEKGGKVELLLLAGRFTGDSRAVSDMLIVGALKEQTLSRLIEQYEKECGFEIRYTLMTRDEFDDRREMVDKFLFSLFEGKHVKVVNTLGV